MVQPFAERVAESPPAAWMPRMALSLWRQRARNPRCPASRVLEGRTALVTGGARGIGLATSRGLAARGAEVVSAARGESVGRAAAQRIQEEHGVPCRFVRLDLGDLSTVAPALDRIESHLRGRRLDLLVANAGLWPLRYGESAQGFEMAFATNVLGHHALVRSALARGLLTEGSRVVFVTGDIYVMARECTPHFPFRGTWGGQRAYCRSKLGNLWQARELARREPGLRVHAVHPGVVASELGVGNRGVVGGLKRATLLTPEQGAQTTLFCATRDGLPSGAYYHNTLGRMELRPDDPACDAGRAATLWSRLETLIAA